MSITLEFYESGVGETIIITFPSGGIGIVDACPSPDNNRPTIDELVGDRNVHFICLTHPHHDHAEDIGNAIRASVRGKKPLPEFWHTVPGHLSFFAALKKDLLRDGMLQSAALQFRHQQIKSLLKAFGAFSELELPERELRAGLQPIDIEGVRIHVLSPEQKEVTEFVRSQQGVLEERKKKPRDENRLSAVLGLEYAKNIVILGADALIANWKDVHLRCQAAKLAKAALLKVPHHGAKNALNLLSGRGQVSYLDLLVKAPSSCQAVLMCGDTDHPHPLVAAKLSSACETICTGNGKKTVPPSAYGIPIVKTGAKNAHICNAIVKYELTTSGVLRCISGARCANCPV